MNSSTTSPLALALSAFALAGGLSAQDPYVTQVIAEGLDAPVHVLSSPLGSDPLFIVEQRGKVKMWTGGTVLPTPFLDIESKVEFAGMSGLVNMVFHPEYANNGWVYLYYLSDIRTADLVRYTVPTPSSFALDPGSETLLLRIDDPLLAFHPGGGMAFGPDGKLYLAIGDRRAELDGQGCTAQDGNTLIGKLLRLNANGTAPSDNPYMGNPAVLDEIYAWGLRQPYRLSFGPTGDMWISDVGEATWEEINVLPASSSGGDNFGWRIKEGPDCASTVECTQPCPDPTLTEPVYAYDHTAGCSVIGGFVYEGPVETFRGRYFYADWCFGKIYAFRYELGVVSDFQDVTDKLDPPGPKDFGKPTSFGTDTEGNLYVVDSEGTFALGTGFVVKLESTPFLTGDVGSISVSGGGTLVLSLNATELHAGRFYFTMGSLSGTNPGIPIQGFTLPLNFDPYLNLTVLNPGGPPLAGSFGVLDTFGTGTTTLVLPPGVAATGVGLTANHAYLVLTATGQVVLASNAVPLDLLP